MQPAKLTRLQRLTLRPWSPAATTQPSAGPLDYAPLRACAGLRRLLLHDCSGLSLDVLASLLPALTQLQQLKILHSGTASAWCSEAQVHALLHALGRDEVDAVVCCLGDHTLRYWMWPWAEADD
jgi:hypothetical protein